MNLQEAFIELNKNGLQVINEGTPAYKRIIDNLADKVGGVENIKKKIDEFANLSDPKDAWAFKQEGIYNGLCQLLSNNYCKRELGISLSILSKFYRGERNYRILCKEYYDNDPEIQEGLKKAKIKLIEDTIEQVDAVNEEMQAMMDEVSSLGLKFEPIIPQDFFNGDYTFKKEMERCEKYDCWSNVWKHNQNVEVTFKDLKNYLEKNPELINAAARPMVHEFLLDNGVDTQSFDLEKGGIVSIGNDSGFEYCEKSEECQKYVKWREEHNNTWRIPLKDVISALKAFNNYPETLSDKELDEYKKKVDSHHEMEREISDYYAHARYTGD